MAPAPSEIVLRAASDGDLRLLKEMAKRVNLPAATGFKGRNALHGAAANGRLEICRFLIEEAGFDANSPSAEGETPILLALEFEEGKRNVHILRYLLARGGDPARPDARGYTPLHNAAEEGHLEAASLLLSTGVPVDPINRRGTPLHLAAAKGHDQVVKILLEHGADSNRVINNVLPPLVMACYGECLKCMKFLVEAGADVNVKGPTGQPVLLSAVDEGFTDVVKFLLEAGADPNIDDGDGEFPIMLAAAHKHRELVEILFPRMKPIPSLPDWSVDGIIRTMKYMHPEHEAKNSVPVNECIAKWKLQGKEAFVKGDYSAAVHFYGLAIGLDQRDATLLSNRSLCWLRQREGELALVDAQYCRTLRPDWSKAWYREGAALSFLRNYKGALYAFAEALKLDPASDEIKKAFREARESMRSAARCEVPDS